MYFSIIIRISLDIGVFNFGGGDFLVLLPKEFYKSSFSIQPDPVIYSFNIWRNIPEKGVTELS